MPDAPIQRITASKNVVKTQLTEIGTALRDFQQCHITEGKAQRVIRDRIKVARENLDGIEALVERGLHAKPPPDSKSEITAGDLLDHPVS